ncbi:putative RNA-directed DNA polymerase from transposon X-element [Trichonephila clavipes]|nr:putative RNA-directed DNA polymerase from transposon X-element [Trichonephila clavipes]
MSSCLRYYTLRFAVSSRRRRRNSKSLIDASCSTPTEDFNNLQTLTMRYFIRLYHHIIFRHFIINSKKIVKSLSGPESPEWDEDYPDEANYTTLESCAKIHFRAAPHNYLRKKCERSLNILKVLSNTLWGADRVSLLRVYQALILSRLDYGCVVYGSARASVLKRLDTVHHSALRICSLSGAFRTSPVTSLYVVCHQPPLELRRRQLSAHYFIRAMYVPSHPLKPFSLAIGLNRLNEAH